MAESSGLPPARSPLDSTCMDSSPTQQTRSTRNVRLGWTGPQRAPGQRWTCLLTTLHPERALSNALVQHLAEELPAMDFQLACDRPDLVWVCGYEPGAEELVRELRENHPDAFLVVTGRGEPQAWGGPVREAGADFTCGWPVPVGTLNQILQPRAAR